MSRTLLSTKQHVIWDWSGTLLRDLDHALKVVNRLLAEENLPATTLDTYRQMFGFPVLAYYESLGFNTEPEAFLDLCARFNEHFHRDLHLCGLYPGARELLAELKRQGKIQSVLSATQQQRLGASIAHFSLGEFFDNVYGLDNEVAASKLERGLQLMERARVAPEDTVLIGDTLHDLEVGKALGISVILVEHGHQHVDRLREAHPNVVKLFGED